MEAVDVNMIRINVLASGNTETDVMFTLTNKRPKRSEREGNPY